jgi:O-acetyl-ADP-ribose deacetylase (regulator of RNase III)
MPLEIVRNDITKMQVDAIVNAANSSLRQGGGVCGAIFAAAGADKLQAECDRIGYCPVGGAVITGGYELPAKYVIHAVGPIWQGGRYNEEALLSACYTNSLNLALERGLNSIAFPLISSGIFGYPKSEALRVAVSAIGSFLLKQEMRVYLVVFDKAAYKLSDKLFKSIEAYIDDNYVEKHTARQRPQAERLHHIREMTRTEDDGLFAYEDMMSSAKRMMPSVSGALTSLDEVVNHVGETFSEMLFRLIAEKGQSEPEVYKRANLDRKLFSKIRSNVNYKPSKNTALALAVALQLNLDQTADLLRRAGYALSPSSRFDLIVEYFIREGNYNIFEINEALFAFDESLLGV